MFDSSSAFDELSRSLRTASQVYLKASTPRSKTFVEMAFKLALATVAFATAASAAVTKRVTCPDGVNTAPNEAVSTSYHF